MGAATLTPEAPATAGPAVTQRSSLRARAAAVFTADLRSLAAFRIALAGVTLLDLAGRARDLSAHYTDAGLLSRSEMLRLADGPRLSVNVISGGATFQALVFVAAALAALAMLAGFYTRLATVVAWLLIVSIEWRNPLIGGGGEVLLRLLLFWAMFLPLGEWWSVDRARRRDDPPPSMRVTSVPVAGLFLQYAFVYWFAALLKTGPEWRVHGTALYDALAIDELAKPLGHWLWGFPALLTVLTFGVLALEALGPFLLLSPFFTARARTIGVALFMSLHLGIWLTLGMGIFPFVAGLPMVCFLPAEVWERVPRLRAPAGGARLRTPRLTGVAVGIALVYVLAFNLTTVTAFDLPKPVAHAGVAIGLSQKWDMFAPSPLTDDGWYVIPGTLADGRRVDVAGVLRGDEHLRAVSWERPKSIHATFANEHWRKYLETLRTHEPAQTRNLGRYVCREWNSHHGGGDALAQYVIVFMHDPTLPGNRVGQPSRRILLVDNCL